MVYRQDYNKLLERHLESGADITVLYSRELRLAEGDPTYIANLHIGDDGWITSGSFGPMGAGGGCYNLGACIMDKDLLITLVEEACAQGRYDFVTNVIEPALQTQKVAGLEHVGYAGRLTTIKTYFDISRDMLEPDVRNELFYAHGPVYTRIMDAPPVRYSHGCAVENSLFGNGCVVRGRVKGSVVFRGVKIERGADVQDCIIMQDTSIGAGAYLRNAIIDKNVVVKPGARLIGTPDTMALVRKKAVVE